MAPKGILGTKLGMTQVFDDDNRVVPVTVIQAEPNTVAQVKTVDVDGYTAVQLAYGSRRKVTKPLAGHLAKAGIDSAGSWLSCASTTVRPPRGRAHGRGRQLRQGRVIDVTGTSKGKGYAGVMKRHNFAGMGDGHGVKKKNRHPGAVGACATPGRTFKGMRWPGAPVVSA
jgi:large subunit ribosomal protein L3